MTVLGALLCTTFVCLFVLPGLALVWFTFKESAQPAAVESGILETGKHGE